MYDSSRLVLPSAKRRGVIVSAAPRYRNPTARASWRAGQMLGRQHPAPGYDRLAERRFQFVPLWGLATYFVYAPRRVECDECGICVEHIPWALGKRPLTQSFAWFLASWAKLLSWQEVSRTFKTSWESVFRSV